MNINEEEGGALPPQVRSIELLLRTLEMLGNVAVDHAQRAARRPSDTRRPRRGATLRPGDETPLWSAVVERVRPHLRVRGAKANLARLLDVPRQRVHDYFVSGSQMPDAERTLHVLLWLAARESGEPAGKSPVPLR